ADADAERRVARGGVVLAVDDVADAADREPDRDARCRGVRPEPDGHGTAPKRRDQPTEHPAERRAPHRDAAGPDLGNELEMIHVAVRQRATARPAIGDVEDARADDPADD